MAGEIERGNGEMLIHKCTVCANEMNIKDADSLAECPSCGNLASLFLPSACEPH